MAGYRWILVGDEEPSVDDNLDDEYKRGMKVMLRQGCSGSDNRCLPIHYIKRNDKPIAPQNVSEGDGRFPTRTAIELEIVRANLQSVDGAPDPNDPVFTWLRGYKPTADLVVEVQSPYIVGTAWDITCNNQSSKRSVYAGASS